ncbi:MAG: 50S ribosomal protein L20 [Myxococcales bacterium]|nr:50S ribosomal protein L20 [Myxococcales bacterium]
MSRVKRGVTAHKRHKKMLKFAKGYWGKRSRIYKCAKETVQKGWLYAYRDRRNRKRSFRQLWIARINAAARLNGFSYSRVIDLLAKANIELNRKVLADLAVTDPAAFAHVLATAKSASH